MTKVNKFIIIKEVLVDARTVTDLHGRIIEIHEDQGIVKLNNKWYLVLRIDRDD